MLASAVRISLVAVLLAWPLLGSAQDPGASEPESDEAAEFEPLLLDGGTSLDVDSDPDLELGSSGTLEFWMAAVWDEDDDVTHFPCVVGRRKPYEGDEAAGFAEATQYSIHLTPDRQSIGLFNGDKWASVAFDFSDGKLHHVAFLTRDASTQVVIDGVERGSIDVGYGSARDLPLHIGSSDGGSEFFIGALPSLRIWRGALSLEQLRALSDLIGPPPDDDPVASRLVAYTEFTKAGKALVILGPEAANTGAADGAR